MTVTHRIACCLAIVSLLGGCATASSPQDPFEPFNRGVYRFNEGVDRAILKPTARAYRTVLPQFVRTGVGNVFSNLGDVPIALNNALQGKFSAASTDLGRLAINTTVGVLGVFDVASKAGLEKHQEDFGQTLGRWGVGNGPFLMLPIFGPSTSRDLAGLVVGFVTDPVSYVDPSGAMAALSAMRLVDSRAELLDAGAILHDAALDRYLFLRDGYLQRRRSMVYDGRPPPDNDAIGPPHSDDAGPAQ